MPTDAHSLTVQSWSGSDGLRAAYYAWPEVLDDTGVDRLCNDPEWTLAYADAWLTSDAIFGWTFFDDERPVALLPFRVEPSRGVLALRRATFLGDGTFDSDYLDLLVRPGYEAAAVERMLDELARARHVDALVLSGVPADSRCLSPLVAALAERGLPARRRPGDCLSAPLPETFEVYVAGLGKRMRSKVRQAMRKAEELNATLRWSQNALHLPGHLARLFELHAKRWGTARAPGSFADERRRDLYERISRYLFTRGELRLGRLEIDGEPVAYQYGAVRGDTYYQLQEGYDPDEERLRSATALRALAIESLIADGVRHYDFMAGASRHKRDWGGVERPCTTLAFALPRWRARIAYGLRAWVDARARGA